MKNDPSDDLLSRMDALEERTAELQDEVTRLRSANLELTAKARANEAPATVESERARRLSRSEFLRLGGAAAAGAVAVGASGLLRPSAASAATGDAFIIGTWPWPNSPSAPTDTTLLTNPSRSELSPRLLWVNNNTDTSYLLPTARIAFVATTAGQDNTFQRKVGVLGGVDTGVGVVGRQGSTGADPLTSNLPRAGVSGAADDNGTGVYGACNGISGYGVVGHSDAGIGVVARSGTGISLALLDGARFYQQPRGTVGAPTTGEFFKGEQIRDANGELFICVATGSPGTWRRVAAVKEGFEGGSVNVLEKPIRLYDSRNTGGILAAGATRDVQVTEVPVGGQKIPAGAKAVLGNITVVATGAGGYLTLFPQGSPPSPLTASINWFATNQVLNTSALVRLNPANGQIGVGNGLEGGSSSTHFVFDASGFVF